ncbi:MAG: hypothetical protein AB2417_12550 [Clostridiaceae bacterium]
MCNLLQNPSFEVGLSGWVTNNVSLESRLAFEGTQAALMDTGIASIYQDVLLPETGKKPLLLSFSALSLYDSNLERPERGSLVVEVVWQNGSGSPIGIGLRLLIPSTMLVDNDTRLTYVEVTDRPPANAVSARLQFSKGVLVNAGNPTTIGDNPIVIDQVILAPLEDINLINNSGFQERLFDWNSTNSGARGLAQYEGTNYAVLNIGGVGTIYQDVPINSLPANSAFMLSFAARRGTVGSDILVTVDYRNGAGSLGIGLSLLIPASVLNQTGWKTYAVATNTAAPVGATIARVSFEGTAPDVSAFVDKVILTMVKTPNLLLNPSFEAGLTNWTSENVNIVLGNSYEGTQNARVGSEAFIFQDVNIGTDARCCYLLTFGAQGSSLQSDALVEVIWLNAEGREIGLGTSLVIPKSALSRQLPTGQQISVWATFVSVTEPSPPEATAARVLFSVANSSIIDIDLVSLTRMSCPIPPPIRGMVF